MVGDNQLYEGGGWCSALKYGLAGDVGRDKLNGFVMCRLLGVYLHIGTWRVWLLDKISCEAAVWGFVG